MMDCEDDYIKDLTLAAELGKTLLERNQELQSHIITLQQIVADKNQEINLLQKHLSNSKEVLSGKLKHLEQIDYQNHELEKQLCFYKTNLDKEIKKNRDLNEAYNELSFKFEDMTNDNSDLKVTLNNLKQQNSYLNIVTSLTLSNCLMSTPASVKQQISAQQESSRDFATSINSSAFKQTDVLPLTPNSSCEHNYLTNSNKSLNFESDTSKNSSLKRSFSESSFTTTSSQQSLNSNASVNSNNMSLNEVFAKWLGVFESYGRKKLVQYKKQLNDIKTENKSMNEYLQQLEDNLKSLRKTNMTLSIDLEEAQSLNSKLDKKLLVYEKSFMAKNTNSTRSHNSCHFNEYCNEIDSDEVVDDDTEADLMDEHDESSFGTDYYADNCEMLSHRRKSGSCLIKSNSLDFTPMLSRNNCCSTLKRTRHSVGNHKCNNNARRCHRNGHHNQNHFVCDSNEDVSLKSELEYCQLLLKGESSAAVVVEKKDCETQCDFSVNAAKKSTAASTITKSESITSYKDIFSKIYETINSGKVI